ncbi:hypothetical protein BofuT4_uP004090.1 [Botrytis cinerea T4]|uniref:Uncharacterized protein n=1 Tax=Botryotinia fuckeliana (strain T4) TaxID=999810 RepID=G2Y3L0_BOTF4|nr:hypothetical protein BofuT4_uP004090.1 [Botrytis cinerea T4]
MDWSRAPQDSDSDVKTNDNSECKRPRGLSDDVQIWSKNVPPSGLIAKSIRSWEANKLSYFIGNSPHHGADIYFCKILA